ncbi:MAG: ispA [Chlamydiia bacterium]|nr:ispA [Chlamydiia bacterium]
MTTPHAAAQAVFSEAIVKALTPYRSRIESALRSAIVRFGEKTELCKACEYALSSGGKRFRPALVFMMADALQKNSDVSEAAVAVELFHTASLIADDLPCMDNDDFRRGRPTTHKVYGEATALLASFALIASGFEYIALNAKRKEDVCQLALFHASKLNGIDALIGGQYLDLFQANLDRKKLYEIMEKKTISLFEVSFILGWLFGGGDSSQLGDVKKAAFDFGAAFQILDDLDDMEKDAAANRKANFGNLFGKLEAVKVVQEHVRSFQEGLQKLNLTSQPLTDLAQGMTELSKAFI